MPAIARARTLSVLRSALEFRDWTRSGESKSRRCRSGVRQVLIVVAVVAVVVSALVSTLQVGVRLTVFMCILFSQCLYPQLLSSRSTVQHIGISGPVPEIRTFTLTVGVAAVAFLLAGHVGKRALLWLPAVAWIFLGMVEFWSGTPEQVAGVIQLVVGIGGWMVGLSLGRGSAMGGGRVVALVVLAIISIEAVVSVVQFAGLPLNELSAADAAILGNRTNGTLNHPDNLGKVIFLLLTLVLPLTKASEASVRRLAVASLTVAFVPLALAQGRANMFSCLALILVWVVLQPKGEKVAGSQAILMGALLASLLAVGSLFTRFQEDPGGGVRGEILALAMKRLPDLLAHGTGPNAYVTYMAPKTGSYIPVHNSFVLVLAELGLLGALAFFLPLVIAIVWCLARRLAPGRRGDHARALLASLPGILLIGNTGWGMMGTSVLSLWLLVWGWHVGGLSLSPEGRAAADETSDTKAAAYAGTIDAARSRLMASRP